MTLSLRYAARSDVGLVRDGNEDSGYAGPRLLAVADGMGGHAAGEVASSVALAVLAHLDDDDSGGDLLDTLADAVGSAESTLERAVAANPDLEGMGTTLTALLWAGRRIGLAHVGDSRAYLLRNGAFAQLTRDHTYVQSLVDSGRISADEAASHPRRSLLTRALDGRNPVEPDLSVREVRVGDRYLLCSDGLSGVVSEQTIAEALADGTPDEVADRLVELALRAGAPDNVTVVVAEVVDRNGTVGSGDALVVGAVGEDAPSRPSLTTPAGRAAAALRPYSGVELDGDPQRAQPDPVQRRRRRLTGAVVAAVVVLLVLGALGFRSWAGSQYFVGEDQGRVTIFRGIPQDVLGIEMSTVYEVQQLEVASLPAHDQAEVIGTIHASSRDDARSIVERLEATVCLAEDPPPECLVGDPSTSTSTATPTATPSTPGTLTLPGSTTTPTEPATGTPTAGPTP